MDRAPSALVRVPHTVTTQRFDLQMIERVTVSFDTTPSGPAEIVGEATLYEVHDFIMMRSLPATVRRDDSLDAVSAQEKNKTRTRPDTVPGRNDAREEPARRHISTGSTKR